MKADFSDDSENETTAQGQFQYANSAKRKKFPFSSSNGSVGVKAEKVVIKSKRQNPKWAGLERYTYSYAT